jgi:hypothetical protein
MSSALVASAAAQPPPPPGALGPTLDLHAGWNMISTPVNAISLSAIQGDCNVTDGPWAWDGSQYQQVSILLPLEGYWVKVSAACTLQVTGRPRSNTQSVSLNDGWNMISSYLSWVQLNRVLSNATGGCRLESGPWWWDGQRYQRIQPDQALDGFKGYWVEVFGGCIVTGLSVSHGWGGLLPPGPPAEAHGLLAGLLKLLGVEPATAVPQASVAPLTLQEVRLAALGAGRLELRLTGRGIVSNELRLYSLSGELIAQAQGTGQILRVEVLGRDGQPLANGVYLYQVTIRGGSGEVIRSEVKKLVLLR